MTLKLLPLVQPPSGLRAAVYLRMSTDHQVYSIEGQLLEIEAFAAREGMVITHTYADPGRSGLTLKGRPALIALLQDIQRGPDFEFLLVYDVSRWGRFQDIDESAFYEFQCRRAGVRVIYCAEPFADDGSPLSAILKGMKRAMAAEYSRELSTKVFSGQCRNVERGFRSGGPPGFGLRRMLVDSGGARKMKLLHGQQKSLQTDRIVLVPGTSEEVAIVREIFRLYVEGRLSKRAIARRLNEAGIRTHRDTDWNLSSISRVLANPSYAGHNVFNRTSQRLRAGVRRKNPPEKWVRADGVYEQIIEQGLFDRAQERSACRSGEMSKEEMWLRLKALYARTGYLSASVINADDTTPSAATYKKFFGCLTDLYPQLGFTPRYDLTNVLAFNTRRWGERRRWVDQPTQHPRRRRGPPTSKSVGPAT